MFKPLSQLNYFFRLATERKLSGSDQLMYLHIYNRFNAARWTETLRIKDAELRELMRLYDTTGKPASIEVLRRGRQRLKAKGFIDFKSGGGKETEYRLIQLYPEDTPAETPADTGFAFYTVRMKDVKDAKTKIFKKEIAKGVAKNARNHEYTIPIDNGTEAWNRL